MVKIVAVHSAVLLQQGIKPGDQLLKINSHPINDSFDLEFYGVNEPLELVVKKQPDQVELILNIDSLEDAELEVEDFAVRRCPNHCLFCFVDQMPPGLRPELYVKDDDYRLSFLHGNFITGTALTAGDIRRIIQFHFSPLHFSVHTVRPDLRIKMLNNPKAGLIMKQLKELTQAGIRIHTQVVLCPGINDGEVLNETITELRTLYPEVCSVGIVPIGLTDFRHHLPKMQAVNPQQARTLIHQVVPFQQRFLDRDGSPFVFLADEFYLLADHPIPDAEHYGDFDQYENGIGMLAYNQYWFKKIYKKIECLKLSKPLKIGFISGTLTAPFMEKTIIQSLNRITGLQACLFAIPNCLFGSGVTVTGLLSGKCIVEALQPVPDLDLLFLPGHCLNADGLLLDNMSLSELKRRLKIKIKPLDDHLKSLEKAILTAAKS